MSDRHLRFECPDSATGGKVAREELTRQGLLQEDMKLPREKAALPVNHSMPAGAVIPELAYPDVRDAVEWICLAFGFTERLRIGDHRSQLSFGGGSVIVTDHWVDPGISSSEGSDSHPRVPAGGVNHSVMVRVADVDKHHERAKQFGARIVSPPTDYPYGERQFGVEDLGGHRWTFSQTIADVYPESWGGTLLE